MHTGMKVYFCQCVRTCKVTKWLASYSPSAFSLIECSMQVLIMHSSSYIASYVPSVTQYFTATTVALTTLEGYPCCFIAIASYSC